MATLDAFFEDNDAPIRKEEQHPSAITRRSLFKIAGTMAAGIAFNGMLGTISYAYADDAGNDQFVIRVLKRDEVGILLIDVSTGKPLADANVLVTSHYNGKALSGKTDNEGIFTASIKELSEIDSDYPIDQQLRYQFTGALLVTKQGFRTFETGSVWLQGGSGTQVATQPLDGKPYARLLTFDGYDIQYPGEAVEFLKAKGNVDEHQLAITITAQPNQSVTCTYTHYGSDWETKSTTADSEGNARIIFNKNSTKWLSDAGHYNWGFTPGKDFTIKVKAGDVNFSIKTKLMAIQAPIDNEVTGKTTMQLGFPFSDGTASVPADGVQGLDWTLPKEWPLIGGAKLDVFSPELPVVYDFDPFGYFALGVTISGSLYKNQKGKPTETGWKSKPRKTVEEQWDELKSDWLKAGEAWENNAWDNKGKMNKGGTYNPCSKVEIKLQFSIMMSTTWDWYKSDYWKGELQGCIALALKAQYAQQFVVGPVPLFVAFDFGVAAKVIATIGAASKKAALPDTILSGATGVTGTVNIQLGVSVGVGVSGVASVGVRGYGYINLYLGLVPPPPKQPFPHMVFGAGAWLDLVLQVLIVKFSVHIVGKDWKVIKGNWSTDIPTKLEGSEVVDEEGRVLVDHSDILFPGRSGEIPWAPENSLTWGDEPIDIAALFAENYQVVPNDELLATSEFTATKATDTTDTAALPGNLQQAEGGSGDFSDASYEFKFNSKSSTGADCSGYDITDVGALGVVPSTKVSIFQGIFSDPRVKIVNVAGTPYLFRIATVQYPKTDKFPKGIARSRLTASSFDGTSWGNPRVIAYVHNNNEYNVTRDNVFDYDFDVCVHPSGKSWDDGSSVRIAMISGLRPDDDQSTLLQIQNRMVFTYISLSRDLTVQHHHEDYAFMYKTDDAIHMGEHPRIIAFSNGGGSMAGIAHYKCAIDGSNPQTWFASYYQPSSFESARKIIETPNQNYLPIHTGNCVLSQTAEKVIEVLQHSASNGSVYAGALSFDTEKNEFHFSNSGQAIAHAPLGIFAWPQHSGCVIPRTESGKKKLFWLPADGQNQVDIGPENIDITSFAFSNSGKTLYYTSVAEGKGADIIHDDGSHTPGPKIKQYTIMAARLIGGDTGRFSRPFPFVDMKDTPIDQLLGFDLNDHMAFVFPSIVSMVDSKADLWFASVPYVRAITIEGASSVNPFVCAGQKEPFVMRFRNDGNVAITKFAVSFFEKGSSTPFAKGMMVNCDFANISPTEWDVADNLKERLVAGEEGLSEDYPYEFGDAAKTGVVLPGETKAFFIQDVPIPESWGGKKEIEIRVDPGSIEISTVTNPEGISYAEEEAIVTTALTFDTPATTTSVLLERYEVDRIEVAANPYAYGDGPQPNPGPNPQPLVRTGDDTMKGGLVAATTAAAGLGAVALAAYNERRRRYGNKSDNFGETE